MVAWRRAAGQGAQELFQRGANGNQIAFSRDGATGSANLQTNLPAGTYCDVIQSDDIASCPTVRVDSSGMVRVEVGAVRAVAIHVGKIVSTSAGAAQLMFV